MKWAIIGKSFRDPILVNPWNGSPFTYGGNQYELYNEYSRNKIIKVWLGYDIDFCSSEETNALMELDEVKAMSRYPADGSVAIVNNTVVIKLKDY